MRRVGTFYTHCAVQNAADRSRQARVSKILVDTGSEHTWIPASTLDRLGVAREKKDVTFVMANGSHISRSVGFAIIRIDDAFTIDEVVFADKGDLLLLGARTLEGLNLTVDARRKKLVAAGPIPVACGSPVSYAPDGRRVDEVGPPASLTLETAASIRSDCAPTPSAPLRYSRRLARAILTPSGAVSR